jgi:hypothetical protein
MTSTIIKDIHIKIDQDPIQVNSKIPFYFPQITQLLILRIKIQHLNINRTIFIRC